MASEDTRVTQRLLAGLGIDQPSPPHRAARAQRAPEGRRARRARPRHRPARAERRRHADGVRPGLPARAGRGRRGGVEVTAIPGPSAVITALAVSGLPTDRFAFEGFLPRKAGERARRLAELAGDRRTLVFFEGPSRLAASLAALAEAFGADRPAAVCRELTKLHEEVRRGGARRARRVGRPTACAARSASSSAVRAEQRADAAGALDRVLELAASGTRLKDAAALVAGRERPRQARPVRGRARRPQRTLSAPPGGSLNVPPLSASKRGRMA